MGSKDDVDLAPVFRTRSPFEQASGHAAVDEADGGVMLKLEEFGDFADGGPVAAGLAVDGEHGLMLLGGYASPSGSLFGKADEASDRGPKGGEGFVVFLG